MTHEQKLVREFHKKFNVYSGKIPAFPSEVVRELRENLIGEEYVEYNIADEDEDLIAIADALGDLLYVVYGAAEAYGIDMQEIFEAIHESNMTKLWTEEEVNIATGFEAKDITGFLHTNGYRYERKSFKDEKCFAVYRIQDGKVIKSPSYTPPTEAIRAIIQRQQNPPLVGPRQGE